MPPPTPVSEPNVLVTVCTFEERDNLEPLIRRVTAAVPRADILIVDDESPDGTGALAERLAAENGRITVLHRDGPRGLGAATVDAFRHAIGHRYELVVNLDADLSHPPEVIPRLIAAASEADVAIGSRYVPGGGIEGWGVVRHVMSRCINGYSRLALGLTARDVSGSFRCYRVAVLGSIDFDEVVSQGYAFMEEVLFRCRIAGAEFREVPITFVDRAAGRSKINVGECVRAVIDIARVASARRAIASRAEDERSRARAESVPASESDRASC